MHMHMRLKTLASIIFYKNMHMQVICAIMLTMFMTVTELH